MMMADRPPRPKRWADLPRPATMRAALLLVLSLSSRTGAFVSLPGRRPPTATAGGATARRQWSPRQRRRRCGELPRPQATAAPPPPPPLPLSSPFPEPEDARAARAGDGGYSVLRQPASRRNWDPDAELSFEAPLHAAEGRRDDDWWRTRFGDADAGSAGGGPAHRRDAPTLAEDAAAAARPPDLLPDAAALDLHRRTWETLDVPRLAQVLEQECTTAPARRILREQLVGNEGPRKPATSTPRPSEAISVPPFMADDVDGCRERYQAVREMQWLQRGSSPTMDLTSVTFRNFKSYKQSILNLPFDSTNAFDLDLYFLATRQGRVLQGPEIRAIADMLDSIKDTILWGQKLEDLGEDQFTVLPAIASLIPYNETLHTLLSTALEPQSDVLSGATFPLIAELRGRVRQLRAEVLGTLDDLLARPEVQSKLALESGGPLYSEIAASGRLVIPVDRTAAQDLGGIVHDTSRSGRTVYVEPTEIVGLTNELRQAEGELQREEARIWRFLTEQLTLNEGPLVAAVDRGLAQLDLVRARTLVGEMLNGVIPQVDNEGVIVLENAKHPVLLLRRIDNVVGSDVDLGRGTNQGLVLTGPNSGGKTVILKLLGLVALMARCGIPVPADRARESNGAAVYTPRVDCFQPVLADIGDIQSVGGDLSTFSGHMLVCREVLANAQRNALVLMDEVGSGTDPNQGVAIAQALLESLLETGARVAITTHFMQLKQLASSDDRFSVGGMQFINGRPTYKLISGVVGESFALSVAERLNLPRTVIERANELLDSETRQMGDLIRNLEDQKVLLDQQTIELDEKRAEVARLEQNLLDEQARLEKKQLMVRREEAKKFAKQLEEKEQALEDVLRKLKEDPSRRVVAKSWEEIKLMKRDVIREAENVPSVLARKREATQMMDDLRAEAVPLADALELRELHPGDMLMVCKPGPLLGREAEFLSISGNRVSVKVNGMGTTMKTSDLALPGSLAPSASGPVRTKAKPMSKVDRALALERRSGTPAPAPPAGGTPGGSTSASFRTATNTVDVRGLTFLEAQEKSRTKFSTLLMAGQSVAYILHGYGTAGVLRNKVRAWLRTERALVKSSGPADADDGGDAFTRVELR